MIIVNLYLISANELLLVIILSISLVQGLETKYRQIYSKIRIYGQLKNDNICFILKIWF